MATAQHEECSIQGILIFVHSNPPSSSFNDSTTFFADLSLTLEAAVSLALATAVHPRMSSPTVQACAMQPRGLNGASPSKISLAVPRPWVFIWLAIGSKNDAASAGSPNTFRCAWTNGPKSHPQTVPW